MTLRGRPGAAAVACAGAAGALLLGIVVGAPGPAAAAGPTLVSGVSTTAVPGAARSTSAAPVSPPLPRHSGTGRRIVYSERTPQHVWLVDEQGSIVRDFAVSGRAHWPRAGTYRVFGKSPSSRSATYGVTFRWMVRFAHGRSAAIGFHTIPRFPSGRKTHRLSSLGLPVGHGGCPHSADPDARFLYRWAVLGTRVVVVD